MNMLSKMLLLALFCSAAECTQSSSSNKAPADPAAATTAVKYDNTVDFICEMAVTPEFTDTCHYKGKVYAFCSESCKEGFLEEPEKYLTAK